MDRAYIDFTWSNTLSNKGIFFVIRQKRNATYRVAERHPVAKNQGLTCDQTIHITGSKAGVRPVPLHRVGYRDPETGKHYVFLTNNFKLAAKPIAKVDPIVKTETTWV